MRKQNVHGEGNYEASRVYNKATRKFVESGRVDEAARDAAPKNPAEAEEMNRAEQTGLQRAREPGAAETAAAGTESTETGIEERGRDQPEPAQGADGAQRGRGKTSRQRQ